MGQPRAYHDLRMLIGLLGMALPMLLTLVFFLLDKGLSFPNSISAFYETKARNVLVGILCALAVFLFTYKGYESKDNRLGNLSAFFALGVAFFPTMAGKERIENVHLIAAALFFGTLILFAGVLFTKTDDPTPPRSKRMRNRVYKTCAWIMTVCIVLIALFFWMDNEVILEKYKAVYWLETVALEAFGVSWFVKCDEARAFFKKFDHPPGVATL